MDKIQLGKRIRDTRIARNYTLDELAADIGLNKSTLSRYERGEIDNPKLPVIETVAIKLRVNPLWLIGKSEDPTPSLPANVIPMPEMRKIPLIGAIACGAPILAEEHIEDYIQIPAHIPGDFALTCKGDSMINARIFDGDLVYIRQQDTVDNGQIAAVLIDGEATLKRVKIYDDHIVLEPENPHFRPLTYWGEEMNSIRILGKAVAFTSMIR